LYTVKFQERWNYPYVIGSIEGEYIRIKCRKKPDHRFTIDSRWPMRLHKLSVAWKVHLNELSSAQLVTELFNKQHNQDSVDTTTISQQVRTDLEE